MHYVVRESCDISLTHAYHVDHNERELSDEAALAPELSGRCLLEEDDECTEGEARRRRSHYPCSDEQLWDVEQDRPQGAESAAETDAVGGEHGTYHGNW